jgi:predicted DCC family thiol-disulfide oxidoreductase YuxK
MASVSAVRSLLPGAAAAASPTASVAPAIAAQHNGPRMNSGSAAFYDQPASFERRPSVAPTAPVADPALVPTAPSDAAAPAAPASDFRPPDGRPILLYNSNCQVCRVISSWVKRQDASGKDAIDERPLPADPADLGRLAPGLDIWQAYEVIHVLMPNGDIKKGGAAIAEVLKRLPATKWFAWTFDLNLFGVRPFQKVLDAGYFVLDAIRPALGCESCGGGPVAWWAKPIRWAADGVRAVKAHMA